METDEDGDEESEASPVVNSTPMIAESLAGVDRLIGAPGGTD